MSISIKIFMTGLILGLSACAAHDKQDTYLLGGATQANFTLQSVRDVTVPNSQPVSETSSVRGANAVKALNEGRRQELRGDAPSGAGDS